MDMNAAGFVTKGTSFPKHSYHLLDFFNILVPADGTYQLNAVISVSNLLTTTHFFLTLNTGIADQFPLAVLIIRYRIGAIATTLILRKAAQVFS